MKHTLFLLLVFLLMLAGCNRPTTGILSSGLQQVEALMYNHPDSALNILQTMDTPSDELNRAAWALFITQAKHKLYLTQNDSLISFSLAYFMETNNTRLRALALYYRAILFHEDKKMKEAQTYYLEAAEEVENTEDFRLAHLVYAGLWNVYSYSDLNDYALEVAKKALEYAEKGKDDKQIISSLIYIARTYSKQGKLSSYVDYYDRAMQAANRKHEYYMLSGIISELGAVYNNMEEYNTALHYAQMAIKLNAENKFRTDEGQYFTIGNIYEQTNQLDSAVHYYKQALTSHDLYTLRDTYKRLYELAIQKQNYKEATIYVDKILAYTDSIMSLDKSRSLSEMQEKYNQQKIRDEAATEIRIQKQRTQIYFIIIIVVVLFVGIYARHRYRLRINRLAEAEDRIDTLTRMLEEAQQATSEDDAFVKRMLLQQLGVIRLVAGTPTAQNQALLRRLAELGNDQVPVEELIVWEDLYPLIDRLYNGFHSRLKERFGAVLTDKEVQTCCLLCAGFSTKEIGVITRQSVSSIYVRKTYIRKKIGAEEGADIVKIVRK